MKVVVLDDWNQVWESAEPIKRLRERAEVVVYTDAAGSEDETAGRLAGATVVVANRERTRFTKSLFERTSELRLIAQTGTGIAHIDAPAATERGIAIATTPGGSTASVAELTIGLMIAVFRQLGANDAAMHRGEWPMPVTRQLGGKTLGLVGLGSIGSATAKIARAMDMKLLATGFSLTPERAVTQGAKAVSLDELMGESDVVSIHLRLSEKSRGLISAERLSRMKSSAILVNTARGAIVDEPALVEALRSGRIAGAGLDVFVTEPLPENNPFRELPTVVMTPHIGWITEEAYDAFVTNSVKNITTFMDGEPTNVKFPEALRR
ncbi:MAG: D-2-hydroxyacid dehydrogenase family protein [Chloroflexi bacterium]|nr:D-2-hydroxyacid dehydrogenase family protein [Chloroflexota bacterium]